MTGLFITLQVVKELYSNAGWFLTAAGVNYIINIYGSEPKQSRIFFNAISNMCFLLFYVKLVAVKMVYSLKNLTSVKSIDLIWHAPLIKKKLN